VGKVPALGSLAAQSRCHNPIKDEQMKTSTITDLSKAIKTIVGFYYEPYLTKTFDNTAQRYVEVEANAMQYQQRDTLYWMRVNNQRQLDKNEAYADKIKNDLTGANRSNTGVELTIERVHRARTALERALVQRSYLEAMSEQLEQVWNDTFPGDKFKMPVSRQATQRQNNVPQDATLAGELDALKALGIDIEIPETHTSDERAELEGASDS
jgi:hypothetical protein